MLTLKNKNPFIDHRWATAWRMWNATGIEVNYSKFNAVTTKEIATLQS